MKLDTFFDVIFQSLFLGGDWGAFIGSHMATLYPENVLGEFSCFFIKFDDLLEISAIIVTYY